MKISIRMLSCAAALLCAAAPVFAQKNADDARFAELARNAARQFEAARADLPQTRPTVPITTPGPNIELTLDDATARALERNLDLAVERLNPMIQDANLERIQAAYRPTLTSQIGHLARVQPPTSQLNGGTSVQNDTSTYNSGLTQALKWTGGDFAFTFNNNKQVSSGTFSIFNPAFNNSFNATLTQPLLRDFFIDGTRQQLK